jgi:hypothetical protein
VPLPIAARGLLARLMLSTAAVCSVTGSPVALAQDAPIGIQRPRQIEPVRPVRPRPATSGTDFGEGNAAPDLPAAIPADDVSAVPAETDDLEPQPANGQRPAPKDGDLNTPEAAIVRDGVIDITEPAAPTDGIDPTAIDTRTRDEAELFENVPTPADPLLLQIEDLDPILDRRPSRLFRFEPYDPIGIRVGSFVLFPELESSVVGLTNVFRSPVARADTTFDVRPSARLVSNWQRHALEFRANGTATFFKEFDTENDKAYTLEARGRLDLTKRTNLQASLSRDVTQESRSAPDGRAAGTRADVTADKATLALTHRFNRLSVQLRGSVTEQAFGDTVNAGVTTTNSSRDYTTYEQAVRASWEFKPTLSGFSEVALNQRDYSQLDAGGINRSSTGERYRVGLSFGTNSEILRGEASIGYGVQHPSNASLPDVSGVIVDANLTWRVNALTSLLFNARSDVAESTAVGVGGVRSQAVGVEARHAFHTYLIGTAGLGYTMSDYVGSSLKEDEIRATLGAEYFLNRETVLFGRYTHTSFQSNALAADYDTDEFRVGVRIRR